ncbi:hypothetical protein HNQ94_001131 [Salirhabdus euzebyi]|uniref:Uncharacterized protein n=1 Tax=Salirhabdus euzebyi TaxID=394506 RepID=A0A841Q2J7_9BACI|nr:CBO0543 family protein [Salirhabdus euzebyi]MBB6452685.1 hypothetical protein [Salirhabdus euzebyi]
MKSNVIVKLGIVFGILSFPTLFRKPSGKLWVPFFLLNGAINHVFDKILVTRKKVKYPVRFLPNIFKINVVYDYLVCPYLSVWFCQSTYHSKLPGIITKLILFGLPQGAYEIWLERKTKTLQFRKNWRWMYSLFLVFIVKILSRGLLELFKISKLDKENLKNE